MVMSKNPTKNQRITWSTLANLLGQFINFSLLILIPKIGSENKEILFEINYFIGIIAYTLGAGFLSLRDIPNQEVVMTSIMNTLILATFLNFFLAYPFGYLLVLVMTSSLILIAENLYSISVYKDRILGEIFFKLLSPTIKFIILLLVFSEFEKMNIYRYDAYLYIVIVSLIVLLFRRLYLVEISKFQSGYITYLMYAILPIVLGNLVGGASRVAFYLTFLNSILIPFQIYMHRKTIPDWITKNISRNYSHPIVYVFCILPFLMLEENFANYFGVTENKIVLMISIIAIIRISNTHSALLLQIPSMNAHRIKSIMVGIMSYLLMFFILYYMNHFTTEQVCLASFIASEFVLGIMYRRRAYF